MSIADERYYVIYWPEDTTWDDSAASSACRNRVTFMRSVGSTHPCSRLMLRTSSLTKICDQIIALLSPEHSKTIVWNDEESDAESVDVSTCEFDRVYSFEVAETNEQEENAVSYPGFQVHFLSVLRKTASDPLKMDSHHLIHHEAPLGYQCDHAALTPRILRGETTQGILTVSYVPPQTYSEVYNERMFNRISLEELL